MKSQYARSFTRDNRGLFIFLLDQSASMGEPVVGASPDSGVPFSKSEAATTTLNVLLWTMVNYARLDETTGRRRDYCDIMALGYGDEVVPLLGNSEPVALPELANSPLGERQMRLLQKSTSGDRELVTKSCDVYLNSHAEGKYTNMAQAIAEARRIAESWLLADSKRVRSSFPPIVLNITDGQHNTGGDPLHEALQLRKLRTDDGEVLMFNCHFTTESATRLAFPASVDQFQSMGLIDHPPKHDLSWATTMFKMSSPVPDTMMRRAKDYFKMPMPDGSRGLMYNADATDLVDFLSWGTAIPVLG